MDVIFGFFSDETLDNLDVVNRNQINSMRSSIDTSGCWKRNEPQDSPSLSSGMAIDKATELVRQFFSGDGSAGQNSSPADQNKTAPGSRQPEEQQQRGRSLIKSKIPLRIQRPASSVSPSHSIITSQVPPSRYAANKPKPVANRIRAPPALTVGRTRSVEGQRQTLSNSLVYTPAAAVSKEDGMEEKTNHYGFRKGNSFHQTTDYYPLYN